MAELTFRLADSEDRAEILEVCRRALGWEEADPNREFFAWKHDQNAFGPSFTWVACDESGRIVGVRCFMRWRFRDVHGSVEAVRAVDTATHPDALRQGIFTRITMAALPVMTEEGMQFVFNTPNDKSMPGYLKMGWSVVGRQRLGALPVRPFRRGTSAWSGSAKWGVTTDVGLSPESAFADGDAVERLLASISADDRLHTDRDLPYLRWRYGFEPLGYRVMPLGDRIEDGLVVFRLRRRGGRVDAVVCDELVPPGRRTGGDFRSMAKASGASLVLRTQTALLRPGPWIGITRIGPTLTWRPLARAGVPAQSELGLSYGDLELF